MEEKHKKDISIGKDLWIEWTDFDSQGAVLFEIDELLKPTQQLWKNLETECVFECCGIGALGLWEEDIQKAIKNLDKNLIERDLKNIIKELDLIKNNVLTSSLLNQLIDKSVFIQVLNHIIKVCVNP